MMIESVYFEKLYQENPDPWLFQHRWYEQRKRQLLMGALTRPYYPKIFEIGCGNGSLSTRLARLTRELTCCDISENAIEIAQHNLSGFDRIKFEKKAIPHEWTGGRFDLIVLSEMGYYLDEKSLMQLCLQMKEALTDQGEIVACHWRLPIEQCQLTGEDVHRALSQSLDMHHMMKHEEPEFLLDIWTMSGESIMDRENRERKKYVGHSDSRSQ